MNLIPAIKELEKEIVSLTNDFESKLKGLEDGLITLRTLNTVCEKCDGEGKIKRPRSCAEDDRVREFITCPICKGTGRKQ